MKPLQIHLTAHDFCIRIDSQLIRIPRAEPQRLLTLLASRAPRDAFPPDYPLDYDPVLVNTAIAERHQRLISAAAVRAESEARRLRARNERYQARQDRAATSDDLLRAAGLL